MDAHDLHLREVTGVSTTSLADAVHDALVHAAQTLSPTQIQWVEKGEIRELFEQDQRVGWQVTVRIGLCFAPAPGHPPIHSITREGPINMPLFDSPIHYHTCGYPIYLDSRWNGQVGEPVFVDARQDSSPAGEELTACPNCQRVLHLKDIQRSD